MTMTFQFPTTYEELRAGIAQARTDLQEQLAGMNRGSDAARPLLAFSSYADMLDRYLDDEVGKGELDREAFHARVPISKHPAAQPLQALSAAAAELKSPLHQETRQLVIGQITRFMNEAGQYYENPSFQQLIEHMSTAAATGKPIFYTTIAKERAVMLGQVEHLRKIYHADERELMPHGEQLPQIDGMADLAEDVLKIAEKRLELMAPRFAPQPPTLSPRRAALQRPAA